MAGARIVFNHFPQLARAMHVSVADVIFQTAEGILDESDQTVRDNSYRTGALEESGKTQYSDDGMTAIVGYDDFKAVWTEYGTGAPEPTRPEPFLTPAAEHHRGRFAAAMGSLEPSLKVNAVGTIGTSANPNISYSARELAPQGANRRGRRRR
jgi:hypothetical protein